MYDCPWPSQSPSATATYFAAKQSWLNFPASDTWVDAGAPELGEMTRAVAATAAAPTSRDAIWIRRTDPPQHFLSVGALA
jgi:hypothetical protein